MSEIIIHLREVQKWYDESRVLALSSISLSIAKGQWLTVTGRSGSGKSTLLAVLAGLDRPTKGRIVVDGIEQPSRKEWRWLRATRIGFVFQTFQLLPTLTAAENVEIPMFGVEQSNRRRRMRAGELLRLVGLEARAQHYPAAMSGGERQRVAIARALANDPAIIIADEPTGNLDSGTSAEILNLLEEIHRSKNTTMIVVTHEAEIAAKGDRTIELSDGEIVADFTSG
ncbi:MAG: ABC transporter ATP-binding protein [Chromatiaceae bacterium]|nr:MAG: ABC transporter ATP-binding protein [Chromatiaceae bacterium]